MTSSPIIRQAKRKDTALEQLSSGEVTYVESRLMGNPPVVAARMAGLRNPENEAKRLEKDVRVRDALEASVKMNVYERKLTRDDVLAGLMDAVNMASTATELVSAWREVGKVIGAYEPQKVDVTHRNQEQMREMSDNELAELAAIEGEYELVEFSEPSASQEDDEQ